VDLTLAFAGKLAAGQPPMIGAPRRTPRRRAVVDLVFHYCRRLADFRKA
jgi:hypothetical protein